MRTVMNNATLVFVSLTLASAVLAAGSAAALAVDYEFSIVAEPGDVIEGRTITRFSPEDNPIAINNHREVVFMASVDGPSNWSIMTPERFIAGAGKVVDGVVPHFWDEGHRFSINDAGQVAYRGLLPWPPGADPAGRGAIFVDDAIIAGFGDVIDGRQITGVRYRPVINNAGTVAFGATYQGQVGAALFTQHELVADGGQLLADGRMMTAEMHHIQINDAGTIAFAAGFIGQNNSAIFTQDGLIVEPSETVVPGGQFIVNDVIDGRIIGTATPFGVKDDGEVAFASVVTSPTGELIGTGLFTQNRILVEDGEIVDGLELLGVLGGGWQFNNAGMYSFLAGVTDQASAGIGQGLFVGGDFGRQFIVGTDSQLFNRTVREIHHIVGMNDRGDLAFLAHFNDGSAAVVMATVPECSSVAICISSALLFFISFRSTRKE